jgi:transposase
MKIVDSIKKVLKEAARVLTGAKRREFIAKQTQELFEGSARKAESEMGWGRETVNKGLHELETGIQCVDNYGARGRKRIEETDPQLEKDIRELLDPLSQADPKMKNALAYTQITAKSVLTSLRLEKGYAEEELPEERTMNRILNRLGYNRKRVQKTKPIKKIPETDAIFGNVRKINEEADAEPHTLRISIDTKAKVNIGEYCRGGLSRLYEVIKAWDHDLHPEKSLVPFGILDVQNGLLNIIFGVSKETSDFLVDGLELWWRQNRIYYSHITKLVINLDNGPCCESRRTQFIKRIVEFSQQTGLEIHLVYYPPYHSKYNPMERPWGVLEQHWNGTLLDSVEKALQWAKTMTWRGVSPVIQLLDKIYQTGIRLTKKEMEQYQPYLTRSETLPKWDVLIAPEPV